VLEIDPYLLYSYRPFRIGFCCERPTAADILEIASLSFTLWGGRYNPVIDVADQDAAKGIVRQYGCDLLFPFHKTTTVSDFIRSFVGLTWADFEGELVDTRGDAPFPVFFDLLMCCWNFIGTPDAVNWLRIPRNHPAYASLALSLGTIPEQSPRMALDYAEILAKNYHPTADLEGDEIPKGHLILSQLVSRALIHLPIRRELGVVVGDVTNGDVLRRFWNMRAAAYSVTLVDGTTPEPFLSHVASHVDAAQALDRFYVFSEAQDCEVLPKALRDSLEPLRGRLVLADSRHELGASVSRYLSRVSGPEAKSALPRVSTQNTRPLIQFIPESPKRAWRSSSAGHFLLDVKGSTHVDKERSMTFRLPYMPEANQEFARTIGVLPRHVLRTQRDGISLITEPGQRTYWLHAAYGDEVIGNMFAAVGTEAALSDKGKYTDRLIRHLGGIRNCRAFKIPGVRRLIEQTARDGFITTSQATLEIRGDAQGAELDRFRDLRLRSGQRGDLNSGIVWDYLLRKQVFVPGSELTCEECSLKFWLSVDDLRSIVTCAYCGTQLVTGPLLKSNLDWKYKRSPLYSVNESLHGSVPVLLTLQQLYDQFFSHIVAWATSMNLKLADGTRCETDFVVASQDTFEPSCLVVGECKTNYEFNETDLRNLLRVRQEFAASDVEVYIVFAKLAAITEVERTLIREQLPEVRAQIIVMDAAALEGDRPFRGSPTGPVIDLRGLARASAVTYGYAHDLPFR